MERSVKYRRTNHVGYVLHPACEDESRCVYCGEPATGRDHFLPLAYMGIYDEYRHHRIARLMFTVPACRSCNATAGGRIFRTFTAKQRYIHDRLRRKHASLLRAPDWSEGELEEIGHSLRTHIEARRSQRQRLLARLRFHPGYAIRPLRVGRI